MPTKTIPASATRIRFQNPASEDRFWWDIRCRDDRYLVCTHQWPFHERGMLMYTVIDLKQNVRGAISLIGGVSKDGTYSDEDCRNILDMLNDPKDETEISHRNRVPLRIRDFR